MQFLIAHLKEVISLVVPILTWALNRFFKSKAQLHVSIPHQFTFLVNQPLKDASGNVISVTQTAHTQSILVRNSGRETATKVELVFNWAPECLNFWPSRHYESKTHPDKRLSVIFDSLAPKEIIGCEVLSINNNMPGLLVVRCDQCTGSDLQMAPQPVVPQWKIRIVLVLMALGGATLIYLTLLLLQFIILRTPLRV